MYKYNNKTEQTLNLCRSTNPLNISNMNVKIQKQKNIDSILSEILNKVEHVDFRLKAGIKEHERLTKEHKQVIICHEIISVAKNLQHNLVNDQGLVYLFDGKCYRYIEPKSFMDFLGKVACKMGISFVEAEAYKFKESLLSQFKSSSYSTMPPMNTEVGETLINLNNAIMSVSDGGLKFIEHSPDYFLKYHLPYNYDPQAECPLFMEYLNRVLPDKTSQNILAEYLGYVFTNFKLEKVLLLIGTGANGKSVFFEVTKGLLGNENMSYTNLTDLTTSEVHRSDLLDKLLNYSSEISVKMNTTIFKQLSSGEPVKGKRLWAQPFEMTKYAKLAFNCNEFPRNIEQTNAFFRRLLPIEFNVTIPDEEQDIDLPMKIINSELAGVFNWVLEGLRRLMINKKFSESNEVKNIINRYRMESNSVSLFINDRNYIKGTNSEIRLTEIYKDYKSYCHENMYYPLTNIDFSKRLRSLGFDTKRKTAGTYVFFDCSSMA